MAGSIDRIRLAEAEPAFNEFHPPSPPTARAELYRRLDRKGAPISWGLRLFNGQDEQQITVLLPNPFLDPETDKPRKTPAWTQLGLWDRLRASFLAL